MSENAPAINFGDAKGLTFERVLIYPTKPILAWLKDCKLYVAITRAMHSAAFVDDTIDASMLSMISRWHE